jgi:hypothetical protein
VSAELSTRLQKPVTARQRASGAAELSAQHSRSPTAGAGRAAT